MHSQLLLLSLLFFSHVFQCGSHSFCSHVDAVIYKYDCGPGCNGTPGCGPHDCGDVPNMCYCDCGGSIDITKAKCETTTKGYKWNDGVKNADGSYALNGTKGDGKEYKC
jgi:hypothetical protein